MYKCKHFAIYELVPPHIHERYGEFAWKFLNRDALIVIDALRDKYGPMICNDYKFGGKRTESGLRTPEESHYSPTSQHSYGNAFDLVPRLVTAQEIRDDLRGQHPPMLNRFLLLPDHIESITIEDNVTWLHVDLRNDKSGVNFFKP